MSSERTKEMGERPQDFRVVFLIGRGSRLSGILDQVLTPESGISVPLVVSHRKPEVGKPDVPGVEYAKELGITAIYWNLMQMQSANRKAFGEQEGYRDDYMRTFGEFLSQQYYRPDMIFMTGWDLVLDANFMKPLKGIPILNVHPHPLPDSKSDTIVAPDETTIPVLRGTEVWTKAIEQKLGWSGATVHRIIPGEFDVGQVVARNWVKIEPEDDADSLRRKLNEVEDRIVPDTILKIAKGELELA